MSLSPPDLAAPPLPGEERPPAAARGRFALPRHWRFLSGWLTSLIVHTAFLLALALIVFRLPEAQQIALSAFSDSDEAPAIVQVTTPAPEGSLEAIESSSLVESFSPELAELGSQVSLQEPGAAARLAMQPIDNVQAVDAQEMLTRTWSFAEGGLEGRSGPLKARLLAERGGSSAGEGAVTDALAWLAAHQAKDGSWNFDLHKGPCNGRCRHSGAVGSTTGATAIALLPFLGAGHTHTQGEYSKVVRDGLYYLTSRMLETSHGGDLQEGTMYAQGLATIVLCEAYAMSGDENLRAPAQSAIDFICNAQHPAGGWRYYPGQPGDTTVFSWQIMALKSGRMARLTVPSPVLERASAYLDSVQSQDGALYGYQSREHTPGPTAIGLLSRMYYGWDRNDPRLSKGIAYLVEQGPSKSDVYFNYYAAQVLCHYGGSPWKRWNLTMSDHLLQTQARQGHEAGSWHFEDKHGSVGGRLYTTAMCAMILQVYYRYLPLYSDPASEHGF